MTLKKNSIGLLCLGGALLLTQCEEETIRNDSVTSIVSKVETAYYEGAVKFEGTSDKPKIETALSAADLEVWMSDVRRQTQDYLSDKPRYNHQARTDFGGYDVGVIPKSGICPIGYEQVEIFMDCEDNRSATSVETSPYESQGGVTVDSNKNIRFRFCRVDGRKFYPFSRSDDPYFSFGLLRLGNLVPDQAVGYSYEVVRNFDNEDGNNKNSTLGDIGPNISTHYNTVLKFLVMQGNYSGMPQLPGYSWGLPDTGMDGPPYAVFTKRYSAFVMDWKIYTDDEDGSNGNWATIDDNTYSNEFPWLIGGTNTTLYIAYHPGS